MSRRYLARCLQSSELQHSMWGPRQPATIPVSSTRCAILLVTKEAAWSNMRPALRISRHGRRPHSCSSFASFCSRAVRMTRSTQAFKATGDSCVRCEGSLYSFRHRCGRQAGLHRASAGVKRFFLDWEPSATSSLAISYTNTMAGRGDQERENAISSQESGQRMEVVKARWILPLRRDLGVGCTGCCCRTSSPRFESIQRLLNSTQPAHLIVPEHGDRYHWPGLCGIEGKSNQHGTSPVQQE